MLDTQTAETHEEPSTAEDLDTGTPEALHEEESDHEDSEKESYVYDIEGEETPLETILEWKKGNLRQSDYSKKTEALSNDRKQFEIQKTEFSSRLDELNLIESELEALVIGELDPDKFLEDDDTSGYLKAKSEKEKRANSLKSLKDKAKSIRNSLAEQGHKQLTQSLGWSDADKMKSDIESIQKYVSDVGMTNDAFNRIVDPKVMEAFLEASKYRKLVSEKAEIVKRVKKAPKATAPKKQTETKSMSLAERIYGKK